MDELVDFFKRLQREPALQRVDQATRELFGQLSAGTSQVVFRIPGVASKPWWEPASFADSSRIEAAFPTIAEDLAALAPGAFNSILHGSALNENGDWSGAYLSVGKGNRTATLLSSIPRLVKGMDQPGSDFVGQYYAMDPGVHLRAHRGPTNALLKCMIGVVGSEGCSLAVDSEERPIRDGKLMIFDDSFMHEAWNRGSRRRVTLQFWVWHPDMTEEEIGAVMNVWQLHIKYFGHFDPPADESRRRRAKYQALGAMLQRT